MLENVHSALLIYNPACGRRRHTRFAEIEEATRILKTDGIAAELAPTSCRGAATDIARQAAARNADLVIFDPNTIRDRSTYDAPNQLAEGMDYVLVNGAPVLENAKMTGVLPGKVLRGPGYQP